jgi:DNA-binding NarL/FixJ family response regulator
MNLNTKTRILIIDDHPIVREGMAQFLNLQPDLCVCGDAGTAEEALQAMSRCRPDMAIVDMTLHGDSGLELVKTLRHRYPPLPILVMSGSSTTTWVAIVDDGRVLRSWSSVVVGRAALIGIMLSGALRVRRRGARR